MAAGTPIVASDLDAFRRVLSDPTSGALVAGAVATVGDAESLAHACRTVLDSPARQEALRRAGETIVARYDWSVVAREVIRVYETAIAVSAGRVVEEPEPIEAAPVPLSDR